MEYWGNCFLIVQDFIKNVPIKRKLYPILDTILFVLNGEEQAIRKLFRQITAVREGLNQIFYGLNMLNTNFPFQKILLLQWDYCLKSHIYVS
jgi:hypothetical protein